MTIDSAMRAATAGIYALGAFSEFPKEMSYQAGKHLRTQDTVVMQRALWYLDVFHFFERMQIRVNTEIWSTLQAAWIWEQEVMFHETQPGSPLRLL